MRKYSYKIILAISIFQTWKFQFIIHIPIAPKWLPLGNAILLLSSSLPVEIYLNKAQWYISLYLVRKEGSRAAHKSPFILEPLSHKKPSISRGRRSGIKRKLISVVFPFAKNTTLVFRANKKTTTIESTQTRSW